MWLWLAGAAWGQDPAVITPAPVLDDRWITTDRQARSVFGAGVAVGGTGLALSVVGLVGGSPALSSAGDLGTFAGAPIMLGASLVSAHALQKLGGSPERTWGYAGLGMFGVDAGLSVAFVSVGGRDPDLAGNLALGILLFRVCAYTGAVLQQVDNNSVRRELHLKAERSSRRRPRAMLVPRTGRAPGLSLVIVAR